MSLRTVCFTGHRDMPPATSPEYRQIVRDTQYAITQVIGQGATVFYTGGAPGYDLLCGEMILLMQQRLPTLELHILLPYGGFARGAPLPAPAGKSTGSAHPLLPLLSGLHAVPESAAGGGSGCLHCLSAPCPQRHRLYRIPCPAKGD